jgi:hypothetical protein
MNWILLLQILMATVSVVFIALLIYLLVLMIRALKIYLNKTK